MPQDGLKSILRPPGSPRNCLERVRTTSIPTEVWEIENCLAEREEDAWRQLEEESCMGRPPPRSASLETLVPTEELSQPRRRKFKQIYDKCDPLNPTDLRRRLEQVSRPVESEESRQEEQPAGDKLTEKIEEKLDDIA